MTKQISHDTHNSVNHTRISNKTHPGGKTPRGNVEDEKSRDYGKKGGRRVRGDKGYSTANDASFVKK